MAFIPDDKNTRHMAVNYLPSIQHSKTFVSGATLKLRQNGFIIDLLKSAILLNRNYHFHYIISTFVSRSQQNWKATPLKFDVP